MSLFPQKIYLACDHAGYELKEYLRQYLSTKYESVNIQLIDLGCNSSSKSVDYPDFAKDLCQKIDVSNNQELGILICGSGIGMSICANKFKNIRAALCFNEELSFLSRSHNNANILCLAARFIDNDTALKTLQTFLDTRFEEGRHKIRVNKIETE